VRNCLAGFGKSRPIGPRPGSPNDQYDVDAVRFQGVPDPLRGSQSARGIGCTAQIPSASTRAQAANSDTDSVGRGEVARSTHAVASSTDSRCNSGPMPTELRWKCAGVKSAFVKGFGCRPVVEACSQAEGRRPKASEEGAPTVWMSSIGALIG